MRFLENDDNQRKTNLPNVITLDPLSLVDLNKVITKSFVVNYVSGHASITLTNMTNPRLSTCLIDMIRVVEGLNVIMRSFNVFKISCFH